MFCASFARVLRTLRSMGFSPRCQLPFDETSHYGAPHTPRKGMDALVTIEKDPKHRVPCYACFAQLLHDFCALCALRAFHLVVNFLFTSPHTMVLPTLRGRSWMHWLRLKMIPNIEFLVMHVLRKFCASFAHFALYGLFTSLSTSF